MNVKTDTKEKFHVITIGETNMAANMTAELAQSLRSYLDMRVKNVVLNAQDIETLSDAAAETIVKIQQEFYEQNASFIVCSLRTSVSQGLDDAGLLELMQVTPTESEAGDIIQLEEIERELADSDDPAFDVG